MEPIRNTIQSMYNHNKLCWDAIDEMGGDTSAPHNLQNLAEAILSIPTGPAVPKSLEELKQMVNRGREIVVGTEIPDVYDGHSNPLIVAQNLNPTNNSAYDGVEGVILVRKYTEAYGQQFNPSTSTNYITSAIKSFLDNEYLNRCNETLRNIISQINIPYYNGSSMTQVASKWFLLSAYEVCNKGELGTISYEGIMLDYWKNKTGLSSPDNMQTANSGRVVNDTSNKAQNWWLRTLVKTSRIAAVTSTGSINNILPNYTNYAVLPACFIAKD